MRILHTADWHLGNMMHNVDRRKEQEDFLYWLSNIVKERKIDALVIAGDIFDTYGPPNWAQGKYYRFLASLINTSCRNIVIVGGNHDSGNLLDAPAELLDALNIHVVGTIANKRIEDRVFELIDAGGDVGAVCAAVPFVPEILLGEYCDDRKKCPTGQFSDVVYSRLYQEYLKEAQALRGDRNIPLIATGHLYAADLEGRYAGMEEEKRTDDGVRQMDVVGNLGKVHVNVFPNEFDYIALGHIHYQTRIGGSEKIRYSGSPFVMGFDEADMPHYVLLVDLPSERGTDSINVEKIEVPRTIRYKRLQGSIDEIMNQLQEIIAKASKENIYEMYCLEVYYNAQDALKLRTEIYNIDFPENVSLVSWKSKESTNGYQVDFGNHDIKSMSSIRPEDIVRQLVLSKSIIEKEGLTDEEYAKKQEEEVGRYMPYFMKAFEEALVNDAENGGQNENT